MFLYPNNQLFEKESKKKTPFTIEMKRIKHIGIKLTKEMKYLDTENDKILMKELKEDTDQWKDTPCSRKESIVLKKKVSPSLPLAKLIHLDFFFYNLFLKGTVAHITLSLVDVIFATVGSECYIDRVHSLTVTFQGLSFLYYAACLVLLCDCFP